MNIMALIVERPDGSTYTLPPEFALDDEAWGVNAPRLEIPGRHGAWEFGFLSTVEPRVLRASATLRGANRADVEALADALKAELLGRGVLKLRRSADADTYITVEARAVRVNPLRGRFGGRLTILEVEFEALDPWWYATTEQVVTQTITAPTAEWTVTNPGTDPEQPVVLEIACTAGAMTNPRVDNLTGGWVAAYTGTLASGQVLVLDTAARTARIGTANVWASMGAEWQARGFRLASGPNALRYSDSGGTRTVAVTVRWRPRFH